MGHRDSRSAIPARPPLGSSDLRLLQIMAGEEDLLGSPFADMMVAKGSRIICDAKA